MEVRVHEVIRALARNHRVLLLGGHAMIFHGLDRPTIDSDVWLDPAEDAEAWTQNLAASVEPFAEAYFWDLANREKVQICAVAELVEAFGVIRIGGLEEDLDVFRRPNNFVEHEFDRVWAESASLALEQVRVFADVDLLVSKADSERQKDFLDVAFLEAKVRNELSPILRTCSAEEARRHFARYVDHETCRAALTNPHPEVQALAFEALRELAHGHNPFAREMLAELGHPID